MPTYFGPTGPDSGSDGSNGSFEEFLARYLQGQQAASSRQININRMLSRRTHEVLSTAARYALEHGHADVDALHLLRVMIDGDTPAASTLRHAGIDLAAVLRAVDDRLPGPSDERTEEGNATLTPSAQRALLDAHQVARAFGSTYIDPEHLFFALVVNRDAVAGQLLATFGVTPEALQEGYRKAAAEAAGRSAGDAGGTHSAQADPNSTTPTLDQFGTDLTAKAAAGELDPVIGRADEIEQAVEILLRRTKNNPVLVGEPGVGKTAVVEGLAQAISDGDVPVLLQGKRVIALDLASMVAGTRYRGDFEERLTTLIDEIVANKNELIVFVDEVHTVVGAGGGGQEGSMDAGNMLKPRLARGDLHLIGATTLKEYRRIEKDAALERRFQPVQVAEPSETDAVLILDGLKERYEQHHDVRYADEAIRAAVDLSARYITDRNLPDKAIDLIDQAGARRRLALSGNVDIDALRDRLASLISEKETAVAEERYEDASQLRDSIVAVEQEIEAAIADDAPRASAELIGNEISANDIAEMVARATGIPAARLSENDRARLAKLETELHERVIGQHTAVESVAKAVRRNRTGLADPRRPVGSFLFLGPTGVGKTELARALAHALFGGSASRDGAAGSGSMIRFDMSEFGERHTVSRLVGAPPGYVGYDEAGQLTERVRRNPYSVILFDEIEKAHPDVFNLLLQVLDDGRLTDGQGRTVDFRNTVIIMTSNIGSEFLASRSGALGFVAADARGDGFGSDAELRARVMSKLREVMRPEFLNRIDEIVLFQKLSTEELQQIVELMLADTAARLDAQGVGFEATDAAVAWIAERGYEPEYGARPLRRVIQREVADRIAELMVGVGGLEAADSKTALGDGATISLDARDGELIATVATGARAEHPLAA